MTRSKKVTVTVRRAEPHDEKAIAMFIRSARGDMAKYRYPERWRWQYREGPLCDRNRPAIWIAETGTRIIGQVCGMPVSLQCGKRVVKAFWGCDFLVHETARGRGLGAALQSELIAESGRLMLLWMNPASHHLAEKQGLKAVAEVVTLEAELAATSRVRAADERRSFELVSEVGPEVDAIWARIALDEKTCGVVRDARYLNWKFFAQPQTHYVGVMARTKRGVARGVAILRRGRPPEANIGLIAELISDDEATLRGLLRYAARYFAAQKVPKIHFASSRPEVVACCSAEGYRERGHLPLLCSPRLLRDCKGKDWYVSRGDSDWDQYPFGLPWKQPERARLAAP